MCSYAHPGHYHDGAAYCATRGQPKAGRTPTRKRPGSERPTPLPKRTKARATQARPHTNTPHTPTHVRVTHKKHPSHAAGGREGGMTTAVLTSHVRAPMQQGTRREATQHSDHSDPTHS